MEQISDLIGKRKSKHGSSTLSVSQDFHGYELLLLKRFQTDPQLCIEWRGKLQSKIQDDDFVIGEIPHHLWYLNVTLDRKKHRFLNFVKNEIRQCQERIGPFIPVSLLTRYLSCHLFTELHLDGIFKYGDDNTLPKELFRCASVRWLSMKYNYLDRIPPDVGRMSNLEYLALTNNKLQNKSIPFTLTFCKRLHTLLLDNNLLDALPGFLLNMPQLKTVHRHGNHNYFKSTFMWYHTDVNERILEVSGANISQITSPRTLLFWAAKAVISSKINFYKDECVVPVVKDYISEIYTMFNVCGHCNRTRPINHPGYKVITFKNPYLGNTCVPFQHWACCHKCATNIEVPARAEQITAAHHLDKQYDAYIRECQKQSSAGHSMSASRLSLRRIGSRSLSHSSVQSQGLGSCSWRRRRRGRLHCCIS